MTALPSKASLTGTNVTQGQFKTALDTVNDYLTGLLGADGTPATARAALGVINDTAPTYAQVVAALGFTPYSASSAAAKLDKAGDTMTGNLAIQNTAPTLTLVDTDNGVTKSVHHNGDLIGFLGNDANWRQYVNNAGQMWASNYGWLHDRFAAKAAESYADRVNNCNWNCIYGSATVLGVVKSGAQLYLQATNCNCDCSCVPAGTLITMSSGLTKGIEDVAVGDEVATRVGIATVQALWRPRLGSRILWSINRTLQITGDHLIATPHGWRCIEPDSFAARVGAGIAPQGVIALPISVGDQILTDSGHLTVQSIVAVQSLPDTLLYSLFIDQAAEFYANGVVVDGMLTPSI